MPTYTDGLLSRMFWTKDDLLEYYRMMDELRTLDAGYVAGRDSESDLLNKADQIMLHYGGSPELYTAQREDNGVYTMAQFMYEHNLTEEAIIGKGKEYLLIHTSCSEDELKKATFHVGTMFDDPINPDERKIHPTLLVLLEEKNDQGIRWYFQFDLELNVTQFEETKGDIHG